MSRFVDSIIAYRILKMLVTPFEDTDAYRLGIIDSKGKELKRMSSLNSTNERDAYSILHRMVFRLKRIIEKVPVENKKLVSFAAAMSLIKENMDIAREPLDLETQFLDRLQHTELLHEDIQFIHKHTNNTYILPFKLYMEEAPANNAVATPGIDGLTPDSIGVRKKKKVLKRYEDPNATNINKPV